MESYWVFLDLDKIILRFTLDKQLISNLQKQVTLLFHLSTGNLIVCWKSPRKSTHKNILINNKLNLSGWLAIQRSISL